MERCLIIVSRDRLGLGETFASRYGEEGDATEAPRQWQDTSMDA